MRGVDNVRGGEQRGDVVHLLGVLPDPVTGGVGVAGGPIGSRERRLVACLRHSDEATDDWRAVVARHRTPCLAGSLPLCEGRNKNIWTVLV